MFEYVFVGLVYICFILILMKIDHDHEWATMIKWFNTIAIAYLEGVGGGGATFIHPFESNLCHLHVV